MSYATIDDITSLWRPLTTDEQSRAEALLPIVTDRLHFEASKVGKDLDEMITDNPELAGVAKAVTVEIVARTLRTSTSSEPMSQMSQSAGGYSFSGTYLTPGESITILNSEKAALGLRIQRYGVIEFC